MPRPVRPNQPAKPAEPTTRSAAPARWSRIPGIASLLIAIGASGALVAKHFFKTALPGCGPQSACGELDAHPMGSLGGMIFAAARMARNQPAGKILPHEAIWPVSFLGLSLFLAMLAAFALSHILGGGGRGLRMLARFAALGSLVYLGAMFASGKFCVYCLAAHAGCLSFWLIMEASMLRGRSVPVSSLTSQTQAARRAPRSAAALGSRVLAAGAAVFVLASGALGLAESSRQDAAEAKSRAALDDSLRDIIGRSSPTAPRDSAAGEGTAPRPSEQPPAAVFTPAAPPPGAGPDGLTGRWRFGPKEASIRLVVYSSYQCRDCKRVEEEIFAFIEKNPGVAVSLTAKHFPMSPKCNKHITQDLHPNSCWAARAAEAAGLLKGNDGFWAMHRWLFSVEGSFTDASLPASLQQLGYADVQSFLNVMQSPLVLQPIESDIEEAVQLGLYFTPLIFVNGVELRGWEVPGAVGRALQQLAAGNLPVKDARDDRPALAETKLIDDWRLGHRVARMPDDVAARSTGAASDAARATLVVWGDYQEPNTRSVDKAIRAAMKDRPWVRYTFRHFPTAADCNPQMQGRTIHPMGCLAARAAEAAAALGGDAAFWIMHQYLVDNPDNLTPDRVRAAAANIGLEPDAFMAKLNSPDVDLAINEDAVGASSISIRSIPLVYLNGRQVMRWEQRGQSLLPKLIDEAGAGR